MRVFVDSTEPGTIFQALKIHLEGEGIGVERVWLHKRGGQGAATRRRHPHYARGGDYLVADRFDIPLVSVERKTLHDLARSASLDNPEDGAPRIFRQLRELGANPMPILLLEGAPSVLYKRLEPMLLGLQFWCVRQGVSIMTATGPQATAKAISLVAKKLRDELAPETRQPTDV